MKKTILLPIMAFLMILFSLSAAALFITVSGDVLTEQVIVNQPFVIEVTAVDDEPLIGVAARLVGDEWQAQSCSETTPNEEGNYVCVREFNFTAPAEEGAYDYELYAENERNHQVWNLIQVNVIEDETDEFIFRTACIDGPQKDNYNIIQYIYNSTIIVTVADEDLYETDESVEGTGNPFVQFIVDSDTPIIVDYFADGYQNDSNYFYFDSGLSSCSGNSCMLVDGAWETTCSFNPAQQNYDCTLVNTEFPGQSISFEFKAFGHPAGDNVINVYNRLYPIDGPIVGGFGTLFINESSSGTINLSEYLAYEGDLADVVWTHDDPSPENLQIDIDQETDVATITALGTFVGNVNVKFTATANELSDSDDLLVVVSNVGNDAPVIIEKDPDVDALEVDENDVQEFSIFAVDPDNEVVYYTWYLNEEEVGDSTLSYTYTAPDLADVGSIIDVLTARASDDEGAYTETSWTITVIEEDLGTPEVTLISPENGTTLTSNDVTFTYSVTDNIDEWLTCSLYNDVGGNWTAGESQETQSGTSGGFTVEDIPNGDYQWNVLCADDAGNAAFASENFTFTMDSQEPVDNSPTATIIQPADGTQFDVGAEITFEGEANDVEDENLTGDALQWTSDADGGIGSGETFTAALSEGQHTITLTATDSYGNTGTDQIVITVGEVIIITDTQAPFINLISPENGTILTVENVTLTYSVVDNMDDSLTCYLFTDISGIFRATAGPQETANATQGTFTVNDIPDGIYNWNVLCQDDEGNSRMSYYNNVLLMNASGTLVIPAPEDIYPRTTIHVSKIRMNGFIIDFVEPGDYLDVDVNFGNIGNNDIKKATIRVSIYGEGGIIVSRKIGPFTGPEVKDVMHKGIMVEIPEYAQPGEYTVRSSIQTDTGLRRTKHRDLVVIPK